MATALTRPAPAAETSSAQPAARRKAGFGWASALWMGVLGLYFFVPLIATGIFSLWDGGTTYDFSSYVALFNTPQMWSSLALSVRLAIETVILTQLLLIPTVLFVALKAQKLRPALELISILPFVVPAIVLVAGLSALYHEPSWWVSSPEFMVVGYVVLALPYTYRSLDVGIRALDVRTLTQAAQSLGASWPQIFLQVIVPNLRSAILGATLLTLAIVLGEFTFANVLLFNTFAVFINFVGQTAGGQAAALSLFSFVITWVAMLGILLTGRGRATATP